MPARKKCQEDSFPFDITITKLARKIFFNINDIRELFERARMEDISFLKRVGLYQKNINLKKKRKKKIYLNQPK